MIMVLATKLKLYSVQCNITAAFVHGLVPEDEEIYAHQTRGFYQKGNNQVLKLKRALILLSDKSGKVSALQNLTPASSLVQH